MSSYTDLINEILQENPDVKKEVDLLEFKYEIISALIKYRRKNNISQKEFAKRIGVKQQMISRFEKGNVDPRLSFISKVLYGINIKINLTEKDYVMTTDLISIKKRKQPKVSCDYNLINEYQKAM